MRIQGQHQELGNTMRQVETPYRASQGKALTEETLKKFVEVFY
jgi:hypothetical protein